MFLQRVHVSQKRLNSSRTEHFETLTDHFQIRVEKQINLTKQRPLPETCFNQRSAKANTRGKPGLDQTQVMPNPKIRKWGDALKGKTRREDLRNPFNMSSMEAGVNPMNEMHLSRNVQLWPRPLLKIPNVN